MITADLRSALLMDANLSNSLAYSCDFRYAKLHSASLKNVNVNNANFSDANLSGADMNCIDIETATFKGAVYDKFTIWPKGFNPINFGCILF